MSDPIPPFHRAVVFPEASPLPGPLKIDLTSTRPTPDPASLKASECLVKMTHVGVCHSDLHIARADWPGTKEKTAWPVVAGHEGIGIIVAIGKGGEEDCRVRVGDRVGIKFIAESCLDCELCRKGFEAHCEKSKKSGLGIDGTFAEYVKSYTMFVTPIPDGFESAAAATIMCAGVTVYRAIKDSNAQAGNWIAIPGAGGGLGHLAIQYAVAMGLRVLAIDTGEEKRKLVMSLGAEKWIDFRESKDIIGDVKAATEGGPHTALITASNGEAYSQAVMYLRQCGWLMAVGLPSGMSTLNALILVIVARGLTIRGSYVGNREDAIEAVRIAARGKIEVACEVRKMSEIGGVFEEMEGGRLAGRVVLSVAT